ncbi:MAG: hypothetical protein WKF78_15170 [Candidatus Limnocylindrales bacterium]
MPIAVSHVHGPSIRHPEMLATGTENPKYPNLTRTSWSTSTA